MLTLRKMAVASVALTLVVFVLSGQAFAACPEAPTIAGWEEFDLEVQTGSATCAHTRAVYEGKDVAVFVTATGLEQPQLAAYLDELTKSMLRDYAERAGYATRSDETAVSDGLHKRRLELRIKGRTRHVVFVWIHSGDQLDLVMVRPWKKERVPDQIVERATESLTTSYNRE